MDILSPHTSPRSRVPAMLAQITQHPVNGTNCAGVLLTREVHRRLVRCRTIAAIGPCATEQIQVTRSKNQCLPDLDRMRSRQRANESCANHGAVTELLRWT